MSKRLQFDLAVITFGNPAIFEKQDTLKKTQQGILRPVAFRPHLAMDLAFYGIGFELSVIRS